MGSVSGPMAEIIRSDSGIIKERISTFHFGVKISASRGPRMLPRCFFVARNRGIRENMATVTSRLAPLPIKRNNRVSVPCVISEKMASTTCGDMILECDRCDAIPAPSVSLTDYIVRRVLLCDSNEG